MKRRTLLKASVGLAAASLPFASRFALAQQGGAKTLRFVPQANLSILDPIISFTAVSQAHGYCIFDTLYGVDGKLTPKPQMAEGAETSPDGLTWTIRLREGLKFHDGEPVRAQDCAASLARWSKKDTFGITLARSVDAFEAADDKTIRIRLKQAFPRLLEAIGKPHSSAAFMMPERLAQTDPNQPITEMIGSGPFRFVQSEFVSGAKVIYEKFDGYVPRNEQPDWTSGGKHVLIDRLEWLVMPDAATAVAALQTGEVDWWDQILPDLEPLMASSSDIKMEVQDPYGFIAVGRFNHAHAPFNNVKLRQIVQKAVNQADYMNAVTGANAESWRRCLAEFPCGMPGVKELGADWMPASQDFAKLREEVMAAGYKGEKVVVMNPTDFPSIGVLGQVTAQLLRNLGFNVDLQETDWGTVVQRRLSKELPENGGWSVYHTNWPSVSIANPALSAPIRGDGSWAGWFTDEEIEKRVSEWLFASEEAKQQEALDSVQERVFEQVPTLMLGQYFVKTAYRNNITGVRPGSLPYFWGVDKA